MLLIYFIWVTLYYLPTLVVMEHLMIVEKNNKKTIRSWAMFDWANSVYFLVISTAVFPPYFTRYTDDTLSIFGVSFTNSAFYSFIVSAAYLILALLMPLLSGMADYGNKKMYFLKIFTIGGGLACMMMYFFVDTASVWIGSIAFLVATLGAAGGLVFYNAYLPQITDEEQYDFVSAKGYTYGYVGSVICLMMILVLVLKPELFGITSETLPMRIGFVIVGLWWIGFAQLAFRNLPPDATGKLPKGLVKKGIGQLRNAYAYVKSNRNIGRFLLSYFFYIAGVNTVIYCATIFGEVELNLKTSELIITVLIIQIVAIAGAYLFAWVSKLRGNKFSLMAMLIIWIVLCGAAYYTTGKLYFYTLSAFVGMVIGGIQSLSRSSYSKMLDEDLGEVTSFYSFYDFLTKIAVVAGTFIYGLVDFITGNLRYSILSIGLFFVIAIVIMLGVSFEKKEKPYLAV